MAAGLIVLAAGTSHAAIQTVLSLVVDVSGSVDDDEYDLQMQGYKSAFQSAVVQNYLDSISDEIAVELVFFSAGTKIGINWTILGSGADAVAFGNALGSVSRPTQGLPDNIGALTDIAAGMQVARTEIAALIANTNYTFTNDLRKIMDVSGDGEQNDPTNPALVQAERNAAAAAGIVVNGLAIETPAFPNLATYYTINVKTANGLVYVANDFGDFGEAVQAKIIREVTGQDEVPEPASLACWGGLMLIGGAVARRRLRAA